MKIIKKIEEKNYQMFMHKRCRLNSFNGSTGLIVGYAYNKEYDISLYIIETYENPLYRDKLRLIRFLDVTGFETKFFSGIQLFEKSYRLFKLSDLEIL